MALSAFIDYDGQGHLVGDLAGGDERSGTGEPLARLRCGRLAPQSAAEVMPAGTSPGETCEECMASEAQASLGDLLAG